MSCKNKNISRSRDGPAYGYSYSQVDVHHRDNDNPTIEPVLLQELEERDSDLDTNDAYGGTMFDIGLVMPSDLDETYTNEHTTSHDAIRNLKEDHPQCTDSDTRHGSKVTVMMMDNAAYYINLSQVTEV